MAITVLPSFQCSYSNSPHMLGEEDSAELVPHPVICFHFEDDLPICVFCSTLLSVAVGGRLFRSGFSAPK